MKDSISMEFAEFMKTPKGRRLKSFQCLQNTPPSIKECTTKKLTCDPHEFPINYLPR